MKKFLFASFLIMFVIGTDTFVVTPLLPTLQTQFHVSDDIASWMVGAYALGDALFALFAGLLSNVWDRKHVMVAGMSGFAVATLLCGFATGFWTMLLFRALAGVSAAIATPQVWASIGALLPRDRIVQGMGIATAGLAVSQAFGVPIGSLLCSVSWHLPFYVITAAAVLTILLTLVWVPSQPPGLRGMKNMALFQPYLQLLHSRVAVLSFMAYFVFQLGNFARFSIMGLWMHERFGQTVTQLGLVMIWFGVGNLVGSLFGSRVARKLGETTTLTAGLVVVAVISLVIPVIQNVWVVEVLWFVTAAVFGSIYPVMMTVLQSIASHARSTVSGLANALMYGGSTIGSVIAGELYARFGGFMAVSLLSAICFCAAWLAFYRAHVTVRLSVAHP